MIAQVLTKYWASVFVEKEIDEELLHDWLKDEYGEKCTAGLPPAHKWTMRRKQISRAIRQSKNSAPGPDNIPYRIWKALGELGVTTLFEATQELRQTGARNLLLLAYSGKGQIGPHDFNAGLLCRLPKKPTGGHEQYGEYYGLGTRDHWQSSTPTTGSSQSRSDWLGNRL